ncbi:hypothetical protein [Streptomyces sp. NPDC047525]|uniref:hypothetical protein n=1 Tax=Streptomyces sp. NPDC047525 TaxID=3155264 RepID=UPI0033E014D8
MIRNGLRAEGLVPCGEQAPDAPMPTAPAAPAANLPKERRLKGWLLVDIVVLVSVLGMFPNPWFQQWFPPRSKSGPRLVQLVGPVGI